MKKVIIPNGVKVIDEQVTVEKIKCWFENGGKAPSIKEQLILKAHEITDKTKLFFESEEVMLLYSCDQTGVYLSCFNKLDEDLAIEIPLTGTELEGRRIAYCVLTREEIGIIDNELALQIPNRGVLLVKLLNKEV